MTLEKKTYQITVKIISHKTFTIEKETPGEAVSSLIGQKAANEIFSYGWGELADILGSPNFEDVHIEVQSMENKIDALENLCNFKPEADESKLFIALNFPTG